MSLKSVCCSILFHFFLIPVVNCQFSDTLNFDFIVKNYDIISVGEYIHGSDNINNEKFNIARKISLKNTGFRIVLEAGMDECLLFNRDQRQADSVIYNFYPVYRDTSFLNFLNDLSNSFEQLYGFDCQYFITEALLPELSQYYNELLVSDSIVNSTMGLLNSYLGKKEKKDELKWCHSVYYSVLRQLDQMPFVSINIRNQLRICILNRISVVNSLLNEKYFWDVRDSLMSECFKNITNTISDSSSKYILLGAYGHLSPCLVNQKNKIAPIKPFTMYLDGRKIYSILISGYKGKAMTITGKFVEVDFVLSDSLRKIYESWPNGIYMLLSGQKDVGNYKIPLYDGWLEAGCCDFYINVGIIKPAKKLIMK